MYVRKYIIFQVLIVKISGFSQMDRGGGAHQLNAQNNHLYTGYSHDIIISVIYRFTKMV